MSTVEPMAGARDSVFDAWWWRGRRWTAGRIEGTVGLKVGAGRTG